MKHLLYILFYFVLFIPLFSKSQDSAFTLKGRLLKPSSISSLIIFYPLMHMDSIPIQADGSFFYSGNLSEAGEMEIVTGTRTSAVKVWIDTRLKNIYLSEKLNRNGKLKLTVDSVSGSEDTYLYYYTLLPKQGKPIYTKFPTFYSEKEREIFMDSLKKAKKAYMDSLIRDDAFHEVDSVFKFRPHSKVLPWLIRFYNRPLGIDYMQEFYYRLTTEQQQSESGKSLLKELNKLQLLKAGNVFEDFSMKDDHGKKFKFNSLKSKYVLIDFWASWCGPCRANHPYLREAYLKTKQAGLEIISISLDEEKQLWLNAIRQDKLPWINVSDLKGRKNTIAVKYKITGIPFSVLLDENRKIVLVNPSSYQVIDFLNH